MRTLLNGILRYVSKKNIFILIILFIASMTAANLCHAGMVSLTFDDGLASVYKHAYPILKNNNQVATIGITYAFLASGNSDYMSIHQILSLQEQGWEVASHGLTHSPSPKIPLLYSEEKITGWAMYDKNRHIYRTRYKFSDIAGLFDNGKLMKAVTALNEADYVPGGYYLDRQNKYLYIIPFAPSTGDRLNIRAISCQRELEHSKRELEKRGCKVETYITPYNSFSVKLKELSKNYYAQVASGGKQANFKEGFDAYHLRRFVVYTETNVPFLKKIIKNEALKNDGWVILCFHGIGDNTGWQPWSAEKLKQLSDWLKKQEIKVVTIAHGAALYRRALKRETLE